MTQTVLLIECPDKKGIVAKVSEFVFRHDANIVTSDQHSTDPEGGRFFMRLVFALDENKVPRAKFEREWEVVAGELGAAWKIHYDAVPRMGILVSKQDHCLFDLLYRQRSGELRVDIPLVISNHEDCRELVERYDVPFHHIPVSVGSEEHWTKRVLELVCESTDFLVLARYMRVLPEALLKTYGKDIINIHHSFLPSFKGADPYRQAYERGVKIIGATAHFVTTDLDEGPIIEQMVDRAYYKDTIEDLKRKGRNLEKLALANAIHAYLEHRIIRDEHKTIVFQ
jgi:formyltetrahydrofolate deformylase